MMSVLAALPRRRWSPVFMYLRLRPAGLALLDLFCVPPVISRRHEHVDHDRTFRPDLDLVRDVAGNRPRVAGAELAGLVTDTEDDRSTQTHSELLVLMLVLGDVALGVELDHAERDPFTVDDAAVDACPDALQLE